jgi:hypothetical protein
MPINAADIRTYLQTRSDFDLELFARRTLEQHGFAVSHGGTYIDPYMQKPRQYDLRATVVINAQQRWRLSLAVECKSLSDEAPLLVSRLPRPESDCHHELVRVQTQVAVRVAAVRRSNERQGMQLYSQNDPVGKRTAQVQRNQTGFRDDDREPYEKWSQALASAEGLVQAAAAIDSPEPTYTLVLPVLVVSDGTLWIADYSGAGVLQGNPATADEATLFVARDYRLSNFGTGVYHVTHLHIYTRIGLTRFIAAATHRDGNLADRMFGFTLR